MESFQIPDIPFPEFVLGVDVGPSHLLGAGLVFGHDPVDEVVQDAQDKGREDQVHREVDAVDVPLKCNDRYITLFKESLGCVSSVGSMVLN